MSKDPKEENRLDDLVSSEDNSANETSNNEVEQLKRDLLYVKAESENYRKRLLKEQEQAIKFANEKFIRELLAVADYFDRALSMAPRLKEQYQDKDITGFLNGIEMTQRELQQTLGRFGVEFFGQVGDTFDPSRHEAISQRADDSAASGTILEVFQKGCVLNGRLLQPAKVVVAENKDN